MAENQSTRPLVSYFLLAFLLSWILWLSPVLNTSGAEVPDILLLLGQFALLGPALAALIVIGKTEGKEGIQSWLKNAWSGRFPKYWLLVIVILPFVMTVSAYLLKSLLANTAISPPDTPMPLPLFVLFILFAGGPLEEFGWRGFALPELLRRMPALPASFLLGALHGLWHLPLRFIEDTVQSQIPFLEFVLVTTVGAVLYTWIYRNTNGSLTAMILFHWAGNVASMFLYYDTMAGRWIFFGLQLLIAILIVGRNRSYWLKTTARAG